MQVNRQEGFIYFGFCKFDAWWAILSHAIRFFQGSMDWKALKYKVWHSSHAYICFYSSHLRQWVYVDATWIGVRIKSVKEFEDHYIITKEYQMAVEDDQSRSIFAWAFSKQGVPYGWNQLFFIAWRVFCQWISLGKWNPKAPPFMNDDWGTAFCNEFAAYTYEKISGEKIGVDLDTADLLFWDKFLMSTEGINRWV